jgi:uncharacterized membrane protein
MTSHLSEDSAQMLPCALTGKKLPRRDLVPLETVRPSLLKRIRKEHPELKRDALVSDAEVARYRALYVEELLSDENGELQELERKVAESLRNESTLAQNIERNYHEMRTLGERMSDNLASFGGSWMFLGVFAALLAIWILINVWRGDGQAFDPYPFILLNLILSCLAAVQAPIIMMSQKRQEAKDRLRAMNDYQVNLKAELEIRHLHEKLDHLINRQWQRLAEMMQERR